MIRDEATGWVEADIVINGRRLSFPEAMALRVAVSTMRLSLHDDTHRKMLGERLADGYDEHLRKVELSMVTGK